MVRDLTEVFSFQRILPEPPTARTADGNVTALTDSQQAAQNTDWSHLKTHTLEKSQTTRLPKIQIGPASFQF